MEIYTVIEIQSDGCISKIESHRNRDIAERVAVEWAKESVIDFADTLSMATGESDEYTLLELFLEQRLSQTEVFVQRNTLRSIDPREYPYRYKGKHLSLNDTIEALVNDGLTMYEDVTDREFAEMIRDRQSGAEYAERPVIEDLEQAFFCSYRGGEKEVVVYAMNKGEALQLACDDTDHPEYWEAEEEL
jgi:hypothetical protein